MAVLPEGKKLFYKGGLITLPKFFAFFVGDDEVSVGNYRRTLVQGPQWGISGNVLYLLEDLEVLTPNENWGVVNKVKLMSLAEGGVELVEWMGGQFNLVFADGRAVDAVGIISGRGIFLKGGLNGISVEVPD